MYVQITILQQFKGSCSGYAVEVVCTVFFHIDVFHAKLVFCDCLVAPKLLLLLPKLLFGGQNLSHLCMYSCTMADSLFSCRDAANQSCLKICTIFHVRKREKLWKDWVSWQSCTFKKLNCTAWWVDCLYRKNECCLLFREPTHGKRLASCPSNHAIKLFKYPDLQNSKQIWGNHPLKNN